MSISQMNSTLPSEIADREHTRTGLSSDAFKRAFLDNLYYLQGKELARATRTDLYRALAFTVRDRMMQRWLQTARSHEAAQAKTVCYLSAEFLLGRQLDNNLLNEDLLATAQLALGELGINLDELREKEDEPGLGNGGLGRLAACFLDSLATLNIPAIGYGIRYEHGIFKQSFVDGWQVEQPDNWLTKGTPWEFPYPDLRVEVGFGGYTETRTDSDHHERVSWKPAEHVLGIPHNLMVPGYATDTVNTLRLWSARASESFNLRSFSAGNYVNAVEAAIRSETISKVLYPDDSIESGRELRLKQQYFFVACSLTDILRNFRWKYGAGQWQRLPDKVAIQLNDTHPTIAIAELMRVLVDEEQVDWAEAWDITRNVFAYTVHTLLPEALEEWPVNLFERLLPRHLQIIYEINQRFLDEVRARFPDEPERITRMSIIHEAPERRVRMAYLACAGSHAINGVAELHSQLLKDLTLHDFYTLWPEKFGNKTNGVTPRRFMKLTNPALSELITDKIGSSWITDLEKLRTLEQWADDPAFLEQWRQVKQRNKVLLAGEIQSRLGFSVDPHAMFDIIVKRLHEYKRQLLDTLHVITLYHRLLDQPDQDLQPRVFVYGAKAAPAYDMAKRIIRLINGVADVVNHDPIMRGRLQVAFLPNFNVSLAERIYPAADLSEQISLAGKEASGTGNMKFALNGAVTIGTLDGANIEIRERVGAENFFLFGLTTPEVATLKSNGYIPFRYYEENAELKRAIDAIGSGHFTRGDTAAMQPLMHELLQVDQYLVLADYASYLDCQARVSAAYQERDAWTRMSLLNTARCGFFSSDRAIQQYCDEIWHATPVAVSLSS